MPQVDGRTTVDPESAIRHAIADSVRDRMGATASVRVEGLRVKFAGKVPVTEGLVARPEQGARAGRPSRFTLLAPGQAASARTSGRGVMSVGYAIAVVSVSVEHAKALRSMTHGDACDGGAVEASEDEVGALPLRRLPTVAELAGAKVVRDVAAGEVLTRSMVSARALVRSGDVVVIRATVGGVVALGRGVAEQSGGQGEVIRVVNRDSRKPLMARIMRPGEVEVVQ